ncbi:hypothetical protein [Pseudomonas fluorescens]|uniref:Lipoprotein n=1 Tax=Pseudomonas fluorescens TaxID=294 RepID=A0A5E7QBF4_PSEFL|nr:hypothetical protein [Pseudomonas fluorescens]VVP58147.1 hypothetical protein PS880_05886 [Pseudomonas fluorescens]
MMIHPLSRSRLFKLVVGLVAGAALLTACSQMPRTANIGMESSKEAKLGTQWGEGIASETRSIKAKRLSSKPDEVASLGYDAAAAVRRAVGHNPESRLNLLLAGGNVEWSVLDENERPLPLQRARSGGGSDVFHLAGLEGSRYTLRFRNLSDRSYEVIATVDGLDVLNGKSGSLLNGGYILYPQQVLDIDGFRKSQNEVAAFRFAVPGQAYAANTEGGDVRNIGVIGAALFETEVSDAQRRPRGDAALSPPNAFPADSSYAPPPHYRQ